MQHAASFLLVATLIVAGCGAADDERPNPDTTRVSVDRVPDGGIQPQVLVADGRVHLIYFKGEPQAGDVYYMQKKVDESAWSDPLRVNSMRGSVIATGTVRGAHLAVGADGRVHVAWMGSAEAEPRGPRDATPMLYARLDDSGTAFEPQRNVMQFATGLDGGGSVAADSRGNVYVAWHGAGDGEGEAHRRVWVAHSRDGGETFKREVAAYDERTGACGCCGMRAYADDGNKLHLLYRAAEENVHRGMQLVRWGTTVEGTRLDEWELSACPMTTASILESGGRVLAAWENDGQVYFGRIDDARPPSASAAPGKSGERKHPVVAANEHGEMLLVWTEGMGWNRGGTLAWRLFGAGGVPASEHGTAPDVPVWSLAAAYVDDGDFVILY